MAKLVDVGASVVLAIAVILAAASAAMADDDDTRPDGDQGGQGPAGAGNSTRNDGANESRGQGFDHANQTRGDDEDESGASGNGRDDRDEDDEEEDDGPEPRARQDEPRRQGHLSENANGTVDGRYVDFTIDSEGCEVHNYSLYGIPIFDSISVSGPECTWDSSGQHGSQFELKGGKSKIRLHDNPTGAIRFKVDEGWNVTFDVASGVAINQSGEDRADLTAGNLSARLFLTGDDEDEEEDDEGEDEEGNETEDSDGETPSLSVSGDILTAGSQGNFLAHPLSGQQAERRAVLEAMKEGRLGGEVDVLVGDNGTVTTEVIALEDVIIKVQKKSETGFRFLVDANLTSGRVFAVNFAPGAFAADRVGVRFYDVDNESFPTEVAITQSDDLQDVLNIEAGEGPEYWIVHDEAGKHVLVAVPSFSIHLFEIQSLPGAAILAQPSILMGILLGVAFSVAAAFTMVAGRKR